MDAVFLIISIFCSIIQSIFFDAYIYVEFGVPLSRVRHQWDPVLSS